MSIIMILLLLYPFGQEEIHYDPPKIYYYSETTEGVLVAESLMLASDAALKDKAEEVIQELLVNSTQALTLIPEQTKLIHLSEEKSHLELTLSNDIMNYGGTLWEWGMLNQILASLFSIQEVEQISINFEDGSRVFVEGTIIENYTRDQWEEREKIICQEQMEETMMK